MNAWLLKNVIPMGLSALLTAFTAYGLHTLAVNLIEASYERKLEDQKTALTAQCEASKALTQEVSNEYQKKLAARNADLTRARRLLDKKCPVSVTTTPACGYNGGPGSAKSGQPNAGGLGADANELIDIAGEGEKYRLQLIGCQDFVRKSLSLQQ